MYAAGRLARMPTSTTSLARVALGVYVLALAVVLFQPSAGAAIGTVGGLTDVLRELGLPSSLANAYRVEFVLNALMFAPVPFLGMWVFPRLSWTDWVAYTFLASAAVELTQGLFLEARSAQFVDVVANTLGGVIGAGAAAIVRSLAKKHEKTPDSVGEKAD